MDSRFKIVKTKKFSIFEIASPVIRTVATEPKSFDKRNHLLAIEQRVQAKWNTEKTFETCAQFLPDGSPRPKFMVTFPYPYMNGRLHLGHAYSLTKAEFAAGFQRLQGKNVLFPFAFHCTGMPIQAAANKVHEEIIKFGCPPVFPESTKEVEVQQDEVEDNEEDNTKQANTTDVKVEKKGKGKKSKAVQKTGTGVVRQWDILKMMVPEEEIHLFQDPIKWLNYFPPHGKADLQQFGTSVDWRRSFITTSVNSFYDSFIRWQFRKLNEGGRIKFGKRPNVYSIIDKQVCMDHERASGEGVGPQEYTIIKLKVLELPEKMKKVLANKNVFLGPATLRPETMYGQTNCFVLPEGDYGAFEMANGDVLVISERSAHGLAHQGYSTEWGKVKCLMQFKGSDLLGLPLKAPNAVYDVVYTLPLLSISMSKGTGVVTSVPSDAPDDFAALRDLKNKPDFRAKFNITAAMVEPFEVVPIIDIPGYGNQSAVTMCEKLKIKSANDADKLRQAKEEVYLKGFYEGVLLVGEYAGEKVCDAKPKIKQDMINRNDAMIYYEPEQTVMSRSGDECIVAFTDQWYLMYGQEDWKQKVENHVNSSSFTAYNPIALERYNFTLNWLSDWACVRQFGLGTKLPFDEQWVIESLSDSTIYMSYYTIAHLLQGDDNFDGTRPSPLGVQASQMTDDVWNYIYLRGPYPSTCGIEEAKLKQLRDEFEYWYPMDLRVSAKDLIPNHLTMSLYNHAEIWKNSPEKWPRGFFTNGHVLVNAEKMSKSKGNFLMMNQCVSMFSADATRFALADAGDTLDDANFAIDVANAAVLNLYTEDIWIGTILEKIKNGELRTGPLDHFMDRAFENEMNRLVALTQHNFSNMLFREGLQSGFFEFQLSRDFYRDWSVRSKIEMHRDLVLRFIETQVVLIAPICPHFAENVWEKLSKPGSIFVAAWPITQEDDKIISAAYTFFKDTLKNLRSVIGKGKGKSQDQTITIYVTNQFSPLKSQVMTFMKQYLQSHGNDFADDFVQSSKEYSDNLSEFKNQKKEIMQFASFMKSEVLGRGLSALETSLPFDQKALLESNRNYIIQSLEIKQVDVYDIDTESNVPGSEAKKSSATPGKPSFNSA